MNTTPTCTPADTATTPKIWRWAFAVAASAGLTGMLCCVAPMMLFMLGLMSGVYAISFADLFYSVDGTAGIGAWSLRLSAVLVGCGGIWRYRTQLQQCNLSEARRKQNFILMSILVCVLGIGVFVTLERLSSWYFDAHIVPAQQAEFMRRDTNESP